MPKKVSKAVETKPKRTSSKQPAAAEEKEAAVKTQAAKKAEELKPELIIQYQGGEVNTASLVEAAKADFHSAKKRTPVTALTLYVKPEEHMAYYVINGDYEGKIPY